MFHNSTLVEAATQVNMAARKLAADSKMLVRISFTRHNLERREMEHGAMATVFEWMVPLVGRHEFSASTPVTPINKKDLTIDAGTRMNAYLRFNLLTVDTEHRHLTSALGNPLKDTPNELELEDASNGNKWRVSLTFVNNVLTAFAFVHDSAEHQELTDYLLEEATIRKECQLMGMLKLNHNR